MAATGGGWHELAELDPALQVFRHSKKALGNIVKSRLLLRCHFSSYSLATEGVVSACCESCSSHSTYRSKQLAKQQSLLQGRTRKRICSNESQLQELHQVRFCFWVEQMLNGQLYAVSQRCCGRPCTSGAQRSTLTWTRTLYHHDSTTMSLQLQLLGMPAANAVCMVIWQQSLTATTTLVKIAWRDKFCTGLQPAQQHKQAAAHFLLVCISAAACSIRSGSSRLLEPFIAVDTAAVHYGICTLPQRGSEARAVSHLSNRGCSQAGFKMPLRHLKGFRSKFSSDAASLKLQIYESQRAPQSDLHQMHYSSELVQGTI